MFYIDLLFFNIFVLYIIAITRVFHWNIISGDIKYPIIIRKNWSSWLLLSLVDVTIPSKQWRTINTGVKIDALFRESLSIKLVTERSDRFGWDIINYGYTSKDELYVIIFNNHPRYPTRIHPGDPLLTISYGGLLFAYKRHKKVKTVTDKDIVNDIAKGD